MKFGVMVPNSPSFVDYKTTVQVACKAEELGYDSFFLSDHYMMIDRTGMNWYITYEALAFLSYLAAKTLRIRLGTCVTPIPFRPPGILAKTVSTMDLLSNGRIILGIGAGLAKKEFEAYSQWEEDEARVKKTREGLKLILRLWTEEKVDFEGQYYKAKEAVLEPKPIQKPHPPIWFGTLGDYMLKLTARYGQGWVPWLTTTPERYQESAKKLRTYARKTGRQGKITFACVIGLITEERLELTDFSGPWIPRTQRVTKWAETIDKYTEAGCSYGVLLFHPAGYMELMEKFAHEVMPSFQ